MKKLKLSSKIFLFIFVLSLIIWIGGYLTRISITYQLFERINYQLKPFINGQNLAAILRILYIPTVITFVAYIVLIVSFTLFISTAKVGLKKNGWLFIITLIIYITLPFEIYLMKYDYNFLLLTVGNNLENTVAINLIISRFKSLNGFPIIELLSYFSIIYFALFQPFKIEEKIVR
ncbi:MAG TPA: hypothetical protein ENI61_04480 [Ignavibacteria bacterium]|nr:hypothetical protein [Ignavibacteria bacterium]